MIYHIIQLGQAGDRTQLTCGITGNHVSIFTIEKPDAIAWDISSWAPYLNHRVSRRRVSCKASSFRRLMERKKPMERVLEF
jgi:hypothetical protein